MQIENFKNKQHIILNKKKEVKYEQGKIPKSVF